YRACPPGPRVPHFLRVLPPAAIARAAALDHTEPSLPGKQNQKAKRVRLGACLAALSRKSQKTARRCRIFACQGQRQRACLDPSGTAGPPSPNLRKLPC